MNGIKDSTRLVVAIVSLLLAVIYSLPSLALYFAIALVVYHEYISVVFCFIFAWNIAKIVKSSYNKYLERKNEH